MIFSFVTYTVSSKISAYIRKRYVGFITHRTVTLFDFPVASAASLIRFQ